MNAKMLPRLQLLENFSDPESQEAERPQELREIQRKMVKTSVKQQKKHTSDRLRCVRSQGGFVSRFRWVFLTLDRLPLSAKVETWTTWLCVNLQSLELL